MGQKTKEVENTDFKLWYMEKDRSRISICILIDKSLTNAIIAIRRQGDKFIMNKLVIEDLTLNAIIVYAP
jgi:hypothetical protein